MEPGPEGITLTMTMMVTEVIGELSFFKVIMGTTIERIIDGSPLGFGLIPSIF